MDNNILGKNIKRRREELEMSQDELAKKLGYKTRSTIARIESGMNDITQSKIVAFSKVLNCSPAYLMGWDDEEESITVEFTTAEEAVKFLLQQNVIYNYTGLDIEKLTDEEKIEYANKVLELINMVSNGYKLKE